VLSALMPVVGRKVGEIMRQVRNQELYSGLLQLWSIQNSILQSFRAVFIASETFVLGFAAILSARDQTSLVGRLVPLFGIVLSVAWIRVCLDRGYDDSYCRGQILKLENGRLKGRERQVVTAFREFQRQCIWQKGEILRGKVGPSKTRLLLDLGLPLVYFVFFVCFLLPWADLLN
jgi:hypothetical protein